MPSIAAGILQVVEPPIHGYDRVEMIAIAGVEDRELAGRKGASLVLDDGARLTYRLRAVAAQKHRISLKSAVHLKGCWVHLRRILIDEPDALLAGAVVTRDRPGHAPLV